MNEQFKPLVTERAPRTTMSISEWEARVDLAAVYRLCHHYGWGELIYNHCSMRVPGEPHMILLKRHADMWDEVTASNLVKVDIREDLDERSGVNRPGFTLHGGLMAGRQDINCAVHIHGDTGMAISAIKGGLRMVSQQAVRFYNRVGYHPYEGITEDFAERERILTALGKNRALILHNHGLVTVGKTAREALILMKHLVSAANIQLRLMATSADLIEIPPEVCQRTAAQFESHDAGRGGADWPAYMRLLDKIDPSFKY
jgi:ribulose-5-phosphate 4-epimerase/fuculose-1-phosphate aldolase